MPQETDFQARSANGLSVVIPCRNEERHISRCIDSLLRQEGVSLDLEIVVVDNGSTDGTLEILKGYGHGITWHVRPDLPIAGLRNFGVERSSKEWVAFIDADVEVDRLWAKALFDFLEELKREGKDPKKIITGSTCALPEDPNWIERTWYGQLILRDEYETKYINSGNLILHRELFLRLGGFDPSYKTGEEENLCLVARREHGALLLKNDAIRAIHHGYPKSVGAFFQRIRWHGSGMHRYFPRPWKCKPLLLAIFYLLLTVTYLLSVFVSPHPVQLSLLFVLLLLVPAFVLASIRYQGKIANLSLLTFLFFCFGWARVASLLDILLGREFIRVKK
jgi:glycosyltransferase involved in cell wall biosynthesis